MYSTYTTATCVCRALQCWWNGNRLEPAIPASVAGIAVLMICAKYVELFLTADLMKYAITE